MSKILFVLSQTQVTGAETYALSLARALRDRGHKIVFVSDTLQNKDGFKFISLPIHKKNTSYLGRFQNALDLNMAASTENADLIHSHSRAANLVSHVSRWNFRRKKIPIVVTVHGRWRNHFAARFFPCLGERTIAVCPYLARDLVHDLRVPKQRIRIVPNGIDTAAFEFSPIPEAPSPQILFVGRFSGQKGEALRFLLQSVYPEVGKSCGPLRFAIYALNAAPQDRDLIARVNSEIGTPMVSLIENEVPLPELYKRSAVIVGSGRVALEAMATGRPVVAIGESSAPGLLSEENFDRAFDSNFGDCGVWNLFQNENRLAEDLRKIVRDKSLQVSLGAWGAKKIREKFDSKIVASEVEKIYDEVRKERK